jgi:hypothetical protein
MFLHSSAGTPKIYTVKALISALQVHRKKCLVAGTTGIAAVHYPGEQLFILCFELELVNSPGEVSV